MRDIELLVPASSLEVLKVAVIFGADAVYIGGEVYGLRAKAKNFSKEDMAEGIAFAHAHGVKVYVTANILAHSGDLPGVRRYFEELKELTGCTHHCGSGGLYDRARGLPGDRCSYQHAGEQYQLWHLQFLAWTWRYPCGISERVIFEGDQGNSSEYPG